MSISHEEWFTETYEGLSAFGLKYSKKLYEAQSPYQKIEIFDTQAMGKILILDGCFMVTEKDTFIYHEMLIHPAMAQLKNAKTALVIGGGDGGSVTELVKYPQLESITLCEIDEMVTRSCQKFFPDVSRGLVDPRSTSAFEDGAAYVARHKDHFDGIFVDSTDPVGPGKALYEVSFYNDIKDSLRAGGIAVFQTESPIFMPKVFSETVNKLKTVFGSTNVLPYLAVIPSYPGALWSFTMCSKATDCLTICDSNLTQDILKGLKYFNHKTHKAAFCLPQFVEELVTHND